MQIGVDKKNHANSLWLGIVDNVGTEIRKFRGEIYVPELGN